MKSFLSSAIFCAAFLAPFFCIAETIGKRPYEMDWANRTQDEHPSLVDFEDEGVWTGSCAGGEISVNRSREQQLFGDYVLKVTYKNTADGAQKYLIAAPEPIPVPAYGVTAMSLWCYGSAESITTDVEIGLGHPTLHVQFQHPDGKTKDIPLYTLKWAEWFQCYHHLAQDEADFVNTPGTVITGFVIHPCSNKVPRTIYFDSLCVFREEFKPLVFEERPQRGIPLFPGQDMGANTGAEVLPFPNRLDTILPDSAAEGSTVEFTQDGEAFVFTYTGSDGTLKVSYTPKTGTWSDFTASWNGCPEFHPLAKGGLKLTNTDPDATKLISCKMDTDGKVRAQWELRAQDDRHLVTYAFCLKGKTLVLDTVSPNADNRGQCVSYGEVQDVKLLDLLQIPFYDYAWSNGRPAVVLAECGGQQFFLSGHTDWYLSNASRLQGGEYPYNSRLQFNGQTMYIAKTDGQRNDIYERFFITISPKYEETLPIIPNPPSIWKSVTGSVIWRAHGAGNRESDKKLWYKIWRHGMRKCLITDHETGWRDSEESFTFRTRTAPGKGGDEGQYDYARYMQDTLGFVYGPYNNFMDIAPVNEFWNSDMAIRGPGNDLQGAWRRCYAPKPLRGVEFCKWQAPANQAKFHFSTAYCDVHTSAAPWERTDYDYRVPGAGTFGQVFYAYGEIMLLQKAAWQGPVYSEGPHYCYYAGLTDGNYGQDRTYRIYSRPWLVDFELLKVHPLECDFGIGNVDMFYGETPTSDYGWRRGDLPEPTIDRFLAATMAFGHTGFLVLDAGMRMAMRSYFMMQQIECRYSMANAAKIQYCDGEGNLYPTTEALKNGAYKQSMVAVDYDNGTHVLANGNTQKEFKAKHAGKRVTLAPNAYCAWTDDGEVFLYSGLNHGKRMDYVESPEYIFFDGRDQLHQIMPKADGFGCAVCRKDDNTHWEIIPFQNAQVGFAIPGGKVIAYDFDGKDLGPATAVRYREMLYILPVDGAFSYKVDTTAETPETTLTSSEYDVFAGQIVTIRKIDGTEFQRIITGEPGDRVWIEEDGQHICFVVRRMLDIQTVLSEDENALVTKLVNPGDNALELTAISSLDGETHSITLEGFGQATVVFPFPADLGEGTFPVALEFSNGTQNTSWHGGILRAIGDDVVFDNFCKDYGTGSEIFDRKTDVSPFSLGARIESRKVSCGGVTRQSLFMHPPWETGVKGRTYTFHTVTLPEGGDLEFQGYVGKEDGSYPGDGLRYWLAITPEGNDQEEIIAEVLVPTHQWLPITADLSPWAGRTVKLRLITDIGPDENSSGDWGCWGDMRIIHKAPKMHTKLAKNAMEFQMRPLEKTPAKWDDGLLADAVSGKLVFRGMGVNSAPQKYPLLATLNGIELGVLPHAWGDENQDLWSEEVRVELPAEALETLGKYNTLVLNNPENDCFKVRDFYLEITLFDGRVITSRMASAVFSQPSGWQYAEGVKSEYGAPIPIYLAF